MSLHAAVIEPFHKKSMYSVAQLFVPMLSTHRAVGTTPKLVSPPQDDVCRYSRNMSKDGRLYTEFRPDCFPNVPPDAHF